MKVRVRFYAQLRDITGPGELEIDLPEQSTAADLLGLLYRERPALQAHESLSCPLRL